MPHLGPHPSIGFLPKFRYFWPRYMKFEKEVIAAAYPFEDFKKEILHDYKIMALSRECSILGRREVLTGKGKFGIFGDGKELPQIALSKFFKKGDFRSGYYRDQTLLISQDLLSPKEIFAALYAHLDLEKEPMSGGRQMGGHFVTRSISKDGEWCSLVDQKNHSGDISPTGSQMPRLVGLAQASKIYRHHPIDNAEKFSRNGDEIAWGTIGNASTSEGMFFEAINTAGVLQIPMVVSVWDDDYGISVHNKDQTTKGSISAVLEGFQRTDKDKGFEILKVKGWDYSALLNTYEYASKLAREQHIPVLVHVIELTQPLGHSSSGSHERYKSKERLEWEKAHDCNVKMREWILSNGIASEESLEAIEKEVKLTVKKSRREAWEEYTQPIFKEKTTLLQFYKKFLPQTHNDPALKLLLKPIEGDSEISFKDIISIARRITLFLNRYPKIDSTDFQHWFQQLNLSMKDKVSSKLYTHSKQQLLDFKATPPTYDKDAKQVDGRIIIRDNFEALLKAYDRVYLFGEDSGKIGDVNQGLEGLQQKFGEHRVADTGIREATIIGQGIGLALRGLRPIAEIQYLDYLLYCIQILSDDLATLRYRTHGKQIAPLIIRTRGHRLEGIWHSGSPMGGIVNLLRGIHVLVPRNMTQAAAFYNTLLQIEQPALVIESLNGYRLKEKLPNNLGTFTLPLGKIEVLHEGSDLTVVSYGSTLRIVAETVERLKQHNISIEVIDIQTLIPFDLSADILKSVKKTNRLLIVDEDVPGGASAYILQQLLENQDIFKWLDSSPKMLTAKAHRPAYGPDGDYYSKPSEDDIFEAAYAIMHEVSPNSFPK